MRDTLVLMIVIIILSAAWFPESTGNSVHKIFNGLKTGWEQVQP